MPLKKVLFIGSFKNSTKDGGVGGQMYASKTIINSSLSDKIEWILIDSTADSNVNLSIFNRTFKATKRIFKCLYHILFSKLDSVLVFSGGRTSFLEKGLIVLIAHAFSTKTIIAPRAGSIKDEINNSFWFKKFAINVFNKSDIIICQSNFWKKNYEELLPLSQSDKFTVVNNAININLYPKVNVLKQKNNKVNILFLGWVTREKGIFELIEAAKLVISKEEKVKFIIAGKGADFDEALKRVKNYGLETYFDFRGWVLKKDKSILIQETNIFVTPTHNEGLSNSLIEAMASGLPCIASNVTSMPDIIVSERVGILFEKNNVEQLSNAILDLIHNKIKRVSIGQNAREHIKDNFSVENLTNIFSNIFFR